MSEHRKDAGEHAQSPREAALDLEGTDTPEGPTDLTKRSWKYIAQKTLREFSDDQCTDMAAALTYYAVLALFPAMLAIVSVLGVVGQAQSAVNAALDVIRPLASEKTLSQVEPVLLGLANSQAAGFALVTGLVLALWSASGYVGAFGRAMNRIWEIEEGRPIWKLRPIQVLITFVAVLLVAVVMLILVVSGPIATSIGNALGVGDTAVLVWQIVKWPVLLLAVVVLVAILYYATPNVRQPKFRWISVGAAVAIGVWLVASAAFGVYVANFSSYNKTYGSLAGVIVFLLWVWLTNVALLFGAQLDAELERGRELQAGLPAEEEIQLPPRDDRNIEKNREKTQQDIERGRAIRENAEKNHSANGTSSGSP